MAERVQVEVAYATPEAQSILEVALPAGATVAQAVEASGIRRHFPQIDLENSRVGIWGKLARLDTVLQAGDRVEIYRPLIADPKAVRRERAKSSKERET